MADFGILNGDGKTGQLAPMERALLYYLVKRYTPKTICEVGTWMGEGSTLMMATALYEIGAGKLYTVEPDALLVIAAAEAYAQKHKPLRPYVEFRTGCGERAFDDLSEVNMAFLDGGDDPAETMAQFTAMDPKMPSGAILAVHDWNAIKALDLRPHLRGRYDWELLMEGFIETGMAVYIKK